MNFYESSGSNNQSSEIEIKAPGWLIDHLGYQFRSEKRQQMT